MIPIRIQNIINNELTSELTHVDIKSDSMYKEKEKFSFKNILKENIKFNPSEIDTIFYKNEMIIAFISIFISIVCMFFKDFFSILNPIAMILLIILFSSNKFEIKNNRHLDIGVWNMINCINIIIKSFNLNNICRRYIDINIFFTNLFLYSIILSGIPASNTLILLAYTGLIISFITCLAGKDIGLIKESINKISSSYMLYMIPSMLIFSIMFKGSSINLTAFTLILLLKFMNSSLENYTLQDINATNN